MTRKKVPDTLGNLFGELDDLTSENTPTNDSADTSADTPVEEPSTVIPVSKETVETLKVDDKAREALRARMEKAASALEAELAEDSSEVLDDSDTDSDDTDSDNAPTKPLSAKAQKAAVMDEAMAGDAEQDGTLTLARYASRAYLEYAMSVVKSRALPDVTDGQKPVQRRILIDMQKMGLTPGNNRVKSARVVGDVLGKYHPHGDQSVYDALVRMAQDFSLRYPLIEGQGNFGSRDGDSQAAMRYTEVRLMPISSLLLEETKAGSVDFVPNYDGNFTEPVALPAKLPMVLLNGASGIAVGMATEIPSHNLTEVAAACELLIDKPEASLEDVLAVLPAPDFPCGGQIISTPETIRELYATGRGKLRVRARYHFEEMQRGQWQLVVDELPPEASSASVLNQIEQITNPKVRNNKKTLTAKQQQAKTAMLALLDRARDESGDKTPVRLVFEPKTSKVDRDEFVQALLSQTSMESNVSVNLVMLGIDGKPRQKTLIDIISEWIQFRLTAVRRRTAKSLEGVNNEIHILEGRTIALMNIDRVIEIIRNEDEPKPVLIAEFGLTDTQAEDILNIRLRQLSKMSALAIERQLSDLEKQKATLERLMTSDAALRRAVVKEIREAAKAFGDERRTLIEAAEVAQTEQKVLDEPVTVVLSQKGFIRTRSGHGHDCSQMAFKVGDAFDCQLECRSVDDVTLVSDCGRTYSIRVSSLPGGRGDGLPLTSFIDLDKAHERFVSVFAGNDDRQVLFASSDGYGFTCQIKDFKSMQRLGRQFVRVNDGARVLPVREIEKGFTFAATLASNDRLLVFPLDEIRTLTNGGLGVQLMKLDDGETLLDTAIIDDRGVQLFGVGRGQKPRDGSIGKRNIEDFILHRARKGKSIHVTWSVQSLRAYSPIEEASEEVTDSLTESAPTLL